MTELEKSISPEFGEMKILHGRPKSGMNTQSIKIYLELERLKKENNDSTND